MNTNGLITQFVLPDLFSSFPYHPRRNPHFEEQGRVAEECVADLVGYTGEKRAAFLGQQFAECAARMYPDADAIRFRIVANYVVSSLLFDDWIDESKPGLAKQYAMSALNVLLDPTSEPAADDKMGILTKRWFAPLAEHAHPNVTKRLVHAMKLCFQAMGQEAEHRVGCHIPDLNTCISRRQRTVGILPSLYIAEIVGGFVMPEVVLNDPVTKSLEEAAICYCVWLNDLYSYNKELGNDHAYNLINVVMNDRNYRLQDAVDYVGRRCNECIDKFQSELKRLPSWGPETDEGVAKYVLAMKDFMAAALHWSFISERYFGKDGPDIKEHRIVHLHPTHIRRLNAKIIARGL